jgi:hypothetical protein
MSCVEEKKKNNEKNFVLQLQIKDANKKTRFFSSNLLTNYCNFDERLLGES